MQPVLFASQPREKGFNTFHCRINIENALKFLNSRSVSINFKIHN